MQRRPPRRPADADQRQKLQADLADDEQRDGAADDHLGRESGKAGTKPADLRHVPVGAEQDDELEQERHGDEADRLDRPQRATIADQRRQRAAKIDAIGDRRRRRRRAAANRPTGRPIARKPSESLRWIGEQRECHCVEQDRRVARSPSERAPPQLHARRAGDGGEHPFASAERSVDRRGDKQRADQRAAATDSAAGGRRRRIVIALVSLEMSAPPFPLPPRGAKVAAERPRVNPLQSPRFRIAARRAEPYFQPRISRGVRVKLTLAFLIAVAALVAGTPRPPNCRRVTLSPRRRRRHAAINGQRGSHAPRHRHLFARQRRGERAGGVRRASQSRQMSAP